MKLTLRTNNIFKLNKNKNNNNNNNKNALFEINKIN